MLLCINSSWFCSHQVVSIAQDAMQVAPLRRTFSEIHFCEGELAYTSNLVAYNSHSNYGFHI